MVPLSGVYWLIGSFMLARKTSVACCARRSPFGSIGDCKLTVKCSACPVERKDSTLSFKPIPSDRDPPFWFQTRKKPSLGGPLVQNQEPLNFWPGVPK